MTNKYIRVKNELPELLEAVCHHADCENWLKDGIWDLVNNQNLAVTFTADYWRAQLNAILTPEENRQRKMEMYGTENPTLEDIEKQCN